MFVRAAVLFALLGSTTGGVIGVAPDEPSFVLVLDPAKDPLCLQVRHELKIFDKPIGNGIVFGSVRDYRGKPVQAHVDSVPAAWYFHRGPMSSSDRGKTSSSGAFAVQLTNSIRNSIRAKAPGVQDVGIEVGRGTFCLEFVLGLPEAMRPRAKSPTQVRPVKPATPTKSK